MQAGTTKLMRPGDLTVRLRRGTTWGEGRGQGMWGGNNGATFVKNLSDIKVKGPLLSRPSGPALPSLSSPAGKIQELKMNQREPVFALFK